MGCCTPFSAEASQSRPNVHQHVNYTTGMVLGVDDYRAEFAYHSNRDKWMVRDLIGYGTASGLDVYVEADGEHGPRVHVTAGTAVAPSGQMICVGRDQCASLLDWMAVKENNKALRDKMGGDEISLVPLYLTLCYTDCAVSLVPIPGEACRSEEELMQPSRVADDYCLSLSVEPPPVFEFAAFSMLTEWLKNKASDLDAPADPAEWPRHILDRFKLIAEEVFRRFAGDDLNHRKPPARITKALEELVRLRPTDRFIRPSKAISEEGDHVGSEGGPVREEGAPRFERRFLGDFADLVMRLWVTRFRPVVQAVNCSSGTEAGDDCVLLAVISLPLAKSEGGPAKLQDGTPPPPITIDHDRRPLIAPLAQYERLGNALGVGRDGRDGEGSGEPPPPPPPQEDLARRVQIIRTGEDGTHSEVLDPLAQYVIGHDDTELLLPLPKDAPGRSVTIRSIATSTALNVGVMEFAAAIEGTLKNFELHGGTAVTLLSDGESSWWAVSDMTDFHAQLFD